MEDIAAKIINRKADYILTVKQNRKQLYEDVGDKFRFSKAIQSMASEIWITDELKQGLVV